MLLGILQFIIEIVFDKDTIFYACSSLILFMLILSIVLKLTSKPYVDLVQHESERFFLDPNDSNSKKKFPSIFSNKPEVDLSVVVPSYNEKDRLPGMLDEAIEYLEKRQANNSKFKYEIIVVDDGSTDKTTQVAMDYSKKLGTEKIRVLTLAKNKGKGGAVRMGCLKSRGQLILFADADGATRFSDLDKLENAFGKNNLTNEDDVIVCGSRRHLEQDSVAKRSAFRTFLMYGFHFLVWFLCVKGVRDTQCGFKLLSRSAALKTFSNLHVERWAFDVDLLYIAERFGIKVIEQDVNWEEKAGSKISFGSYLQMGKDLVFIRLHYLLGAWKLDSNLKLKLD